MPPDGSNPLFAARAVELLLAAVAEFGGIRPAAAELGIARSTLFDIVSGVTAAPSQATIERLVEGYNELPVWRRGQLQSGADLFAGLAREDRNLFRQLALADPKRYQADVKAAFETRRQEAERRKSRNLPPLESASP